MLLFITILIFSLNSCCFPGFQVSFISYNTNTGKYTTRQNVKVKTGELFGNVKDQIVNPFVKEGYKYTFKHWTETVPTEGDIDISSEAVDDNTEIKKNTTVYAVYTSSDVLYTVTFKYFNGTGYENKSVKDDVSYDKKFSEIDKPTTLDDIVIGGTKYSFFGWADVETSSTIIEEFQKDKVDDNFPITSDKTFCAIYQGDYLCFTSKLNYGQIYFNIVGTLSNPISLQYRKDSDTEFKDYTWGGSTSATRGEGLRISLNADEKVYFKGNNSTFSKNNSNYVRFYSGKNIEGSGSIMSLLNNRDITSNYCFTYLFRQCSNLLKAPELTAINLADYCYYYMFNECTSLTTAPELPATTLAEHCYDSMFRGSALTIAPELPATTLAEYCYDSMFYRCSALTTAPELPVKILVNSCYKSMFAYCSALTIAPELPATTLAEHCYDSMFRGSALTIAPELNASTLANFCYFYMFNECTSLTTAPELPATTLAEYCYGNMFMRCTALTTAPELPATTLMTSCYVNMFQGCTALETSPELPALNLKTRCYYGMFYNCSSLTIAPELPATTLVGYCYGNMFENCSSLTSVTCYATNLGSGSGIINWLENVAPNGTFKCKSSATWPRGGTGIPDGWTVEYI